MFSAAQYSWMYSSSAVGVGPLQVLPAVPNLPNSGNAYTYPWKTGNATNPLNVYNYSSGATSTSSTTISSVSSSTIGFGNATNGIISDGASICNVYNYSGNSWSIGGLSGTTSFGISTSAGATGNSTTAIATGNGISAIYNYGTNSYVVGPTISNGWHYGSGVGTAAVGFFAGGQQTTANSKYYTYSSNAFSTCTTTFETCQTAASGNGQQAVFYMGYSAGGGAIQILSYSSVTIATATAVQPTNFKNNFIQTSVTGNAIESFVACDYNNAIMATSIYNYSNGTNVTGPNMSVIPNNAQICGAFSSSNYSVLGG